ncbi:MAG: hypothetical protein ACF8Q5_12935 [Phycisphaerales bacterium JB040]
MNRMLYSTAIALGVILTSGCGVKEVVNQEKQLTQLRASADAAFVNRDYERASEDYRAYLEILPNVAEVRYRLGISELEMGRLSSAKTHLAVAHDLVPGNDTYTIGYGRAIVEGGDEGELFNYIRNLLESAVTADTYIAVGEIAWMGGLHDEAERAYRTAVTLAGATSVEPHRELAHFYRSIGDAESEIERWRVVLSFDLNDPEANSRLRSLGVIPGPSMALQPNDALPEG